MVAAGYSAEEIPLDPGPEGWLSMGAADLAEFCPERLRPPQTASGPLGCAPAGSGQ